MTTPIPNLPFRGELWDLTALQAVRLLGEMAQLGLTIDLKQHAELAEVTDLTQDDVESILERASDAWDAIKAHIGHGAPDGELSPPEMVAFMADEAFKELT